MSAETCEHISTAVSSFVTSLHRDVLPSPTDLQTQADAAPQPGSALSCHQAADTVVGHPGDLTTLGQTHEAVETADDVKRL